MLEKPVCTRLELLGQPIRVILDLDVAGLDGAFTAVSQLFETDTGLDGAYLDGIRAALLRHRDIGPEAIDGGQAIFHERIRDADGPPITLLVRTTRPLPIQDRPGEDPRFLWILLSSAATHPRLGAAVEFARLMRHAPFAAAAVSASNAEDLIVIFERELSDELGFLHIPEELQATGRLFGGMANDLRRRLPHWVDDFKAGFHPKVVASILFMYFACLAPAVAFGGLMSTLTGGQIGVVETMLASAVSGVLWSIFAGQPLPIVGATGPNVVFTGLLYGACVSYDLPFLPTAAWTGMWTGVLLITAAALDASALIRYFTRFTDEIFSALIALIFISEAARDLMGAFVDPALSDATALLSLLLGLGTFALALSLARFRRSPYLRAWIRDFLGDFGPTIALAVMTALGLWMSSVHLPSLDVPAAFAPTTARPWLVNPFDAPRWVWGASVLPAILLTLLIWVNQNITARLTNSPDYRLKKGPAYHWDIAVVGALVILMSLFGLPWVVGAAVRSLNHVKSLVVTEGGEVVGAIENRLSNLGIHLLIGASLAMLPLLANVPMAVIFGLFLFMGFGSFSGNQFVDRLRLWVMDPERYPVTHYHRIVPTPVVHTYTAIQMFCLAVLWLIKASALGILFPLFVAMLVPVRMVLRRAFRPEDLGLLDGESVPADEEYREVLT